MPKKQPAEPIGHPPLWTETIRDEFGMCYYVLYMRLLDTFKDCQEGWSDTKPSPFIANIRALCCLLRAHPLYPRNLQFEKWQVEQWCEYVETNMSKCKLSLPPKRAKEFKECVQADLNFLREFMDRKRDRKTDVTC